MIKKGGSVSMKKIVKKISLIISNIAVISACARYPFYTYANYNNFTNEAYQEFISDYEITPRENELLDMMGTDWLGNDCLHLYGSIYDMKDYYATGHIVEYGNESVRRLTKGYIQWHIYTANSTEKEIHSADEINSFLKYNNHKATVGTYRIAARDYGAYMEMSLNFDDNASIDDMVDIALAMYDEFGYRPSGLFELTTTEFYNETMESSSITFGTPTIAGDIDMNGESGMADIVKLSKYTSNVELFPITDPTALANADVTQDGVIDALDTNMLIEIALGSYENAL